MALSINWGTGVINVLRADMVLTQTVPTEIRKLDLNQFRLDLKGLEDDPDGMAFLRTHTHNTSITLGGVVYARAVEIINNYTVTFEDGQYAVNMVGANSNVADVVNVNQVSVRTNNSAGLQDLSTLLIAAYGGEVAIDLVKGQAGISIPIGTRDVPSNNLADTNLIADSNGLKKIRILRSMSLDLVDFSDGHTFIGDNPITVLVNILDSVNIQNCEFKNMTVRGVLDGGNIISDCSILDLTYTDGKVFNCTIDDKITVAPNSQATIINCTSVIAGGQQKPIIDLGLTGSLALRNYTGGILIQNFDGTGEISIDMISGKVIIDATCTGGEITVRGNAIVVDNSGVGCTVKSTADALNTPLTESYALAGEHPTVAQALLLIQQMLTDFSITGTTYTVNKLDGVTPARTLTLDDEKAPTALRKD
jgi:hypothetical protein